MSMGVNFHSDGKPYLVEVGLYEHAGASPGTGWLTIKTSYGDDVTLHELDARQMDMIGRAIRYAAAKLEMQATLKQTPQQERKVEADKWFDELLEEHGDPVG